MNSISRYILNKSGSTALEVAKDIHKKFDEDSDLLVCFNSVLDGKAVMISYSKCEHLLGLSGMVALTVHVNECPAGIEVTAAVAGPERNNIFLYTSEEMFLGRLEEILTSLGFEKTEAPETYSESKGTATGIEIEKKFLVKELPDNLESYPYHIIEQGYLNVSPAVRVRREDDKYYMTYKGAAPAGSDTIGKVEYNMPLDEAAYTHMVAKCDGNIIKKTRYLIPLNEDAFDSEFLASDPGLRAAIGNGEIKIELDVFKAPFEGRILAEVEFPSEEAARAYHMASWFSEDVTGNHAYSNSTMSTEKI